LGSATTEALIAHAAGYLPAACRVDDEFSGIDLGTGAGVPGVILAALRPRSRWTLVDANERRCEYAAAAVRSLAMSGRVSVLHARVEDVAHDPNHRHAHHLVVARSFGPPADLAECALPLVATDGLLVVSVVEATLEKWRSAVAAIGVDVDTSVGVDGTQYVQVRAPTSVPDGWPRRAPARRRTPLF
jgi:16S rRNA G527 N7-methylase RsmG